MSNKFASNPNLAIQNQLVQWINDAGMADGGKKVNLLRKIVEVLLHQGSQYIPLYIQNILSFGGDRSNNVKKQVIVFIEEISKNFPQYLPEVISQLQLLVMDTVVVVQKRAIQAASILYRNTLLWICEGRASEADMQNVWEHLSEIKLIILNMIDNDNEGIRTHSVKFLEEVILLQSPGEIVTDSDFSLDSLPTHLSFIKRDLLEKESDQIFNLIVNFHNSQHISSVNLMACMTTLCLLCKSRPKYMARVIQALGDLHTTLPPTLTQSQVNSVRKQLKIQLINLIKHSSANDHMPQLIQLLMDIGMTNSEINKALPKEKRSKRLGEVKMSEIPSKRFRIDSPQNSQSSDSNSRSELITEIRSEVTREVPKDDFTRIDADDDSNSQVSLTQAPVKEDKPVSEDTFFEGLNNVDLVVDLVMSTLVNGLPNEIPPTFTSLYKPIPNSGSKVQKRSLAKLIMALIKNELESLEPAPMPVQPPALEPEIPFVTQPSLSEIAAKIPLIKDEESEKNTLKNAVAKLQETSKAERQMESAVSSAVSKLMEETRADHLKEEERKTKDKEKPIPPQTPTVPKLKQKVKLLKLHEITRPIPKEIKEKMVLQAVDRILRAEKESIIGGAAQIRSKFITIFASSYTPEIRDLVLNYILDDPVNRIDLALHWLYEEYAFMQGFNRHPVTLQPKMHEKHDQNYSHLLCALITQICERGDPVMEASKEMLLRKIYSECPVVTDEAIDYLKHLVTEEKVATVALEILEDICIMRPPRSHKYVAALVCHVLNQQEEIREATLKSIIKIYTRSTDATRKVIEKQARLYLGFIALASPPSEVLAARTTFRMPWTEHFYKLCLNLIMTLLLENEDLIIEVARVYGCCDPEAKRVVLRCVEAPVRAAISKGVPAAGLRPAFAALLDECPRGAETLLTRLVHIFTEKSPPTPELVSKIRDLYATRVSDVRFLIPVLTGLTKKEILAALPKFIKLNPAVVKEVFNKLLGLQNPDEQCPVSPTELLVALHLIDPSKAELKFIIKATAICFGEKHIFTQDVVSAVLQRLTEESEIPVLMMRSVLQALTLYPALEALALNILQLLVEKEVWLNKVAWEGWIKCCERLLPASTFLLHSLPPAVLPACTAVPRLHAALQTHASDLPQTQSDPPYGSTTPPMPVPMPVPMPAVNPLEPLPPGME